MNREIKFRAWVGKMVMVNSFYLIYEPDGIYYHILVDDNSTIFPSEYILKKDEPLMQFTGLYDRNKKPIYEGDILQTSHGRGKIEFDNGLFSLHSIWKTGHVYISPPFNEYEIIGNIYKNPELLNATD